MEILKKTNDAREKKKVVINFGKVARGGGGGIGTVILLGGALVTAAFASAFIVRKKGRGSGNNSNGKAHNPPPTSPAAVNKENEQDEVNRRMQFTFLDTSLHATKHPSGETRKDIEITNNTQSLVLDEKPRIEINGGPPFDACDSEATKASEQILLSSIAPKVPENGVISDGSVTNKGEFHLPVVEEKILPPKLENVKIESLKHDAIDEITGECDGFKEVKAGGESRGDIEINKVKCEEAMEEIAQDVAGITLKLGEEGICSDQDVTGNNGFMPGTFVLESHRKDGQERTLPVFETPATEHKNVNGDTKHGFAGMSTEVVEIIHEDGVIEKDDENQVKHMEEEITLEKDNAIEEGEEHLVIEEEIMPEKCKEDNKGQRSEVSNDEKILCQKIEENACIDDPQIGDYDKDVQILTISTPEEEMIFHKDIEVSKEDAANEEDYICPQKDPKDEVEKNTKVEGLSETTDTGIEVAKNEKNIIEDFADETVDEEDLFDQIDHNSEGTEDSSMESNVGVVWPDEAIQESFIETLQMKLINQEVEGKIEEDKQVKQGKCEGQQAKADKGNSNEVIADSTHITSNVTGNSAKSLFEKYVVDPATLKYYSTNTNTRRLLIATIPVLSSLSCSWFFGLSFDKLCLVVLLTIVLSKSMIIE